MSPETLGSVSMSAVGCTVSLKPSVSEHARSDPHGTLATCRFQVLEFPRHAPPPVGSSLTCKRRQSPVLAGRLHHGVNLKGILGRVDGPAHSRIASASADGRAFVACSRWSSRGTGVDVAADYRFDPIDSQIVASTPARTLSLSAQGRSLVGGDDVPVARQE